MEQKSIIRNKISNILNLAIFGVLFLLVFIFPFKFNMPFAEGMSQFFPKDLDEWMFFSWPEAIACFLILFAFVLTLFRFLAEGEIVIVKTSFDLWIIGFLSALVLSFCFSLNQYRSQVFVVRSFMCFLLYYIVLFNSRDFKLWRFLLIAVISASMVLCLYGLYQFFYGLSETRIWVMQAREGGFFFSQELMQRLSGNRIFSAFVYPNAFAAYLLFVIPLGISVFFLKGKDAKIRFFGYSALGALILSVLFLVMIGKKALLLNVALLLVAYPLTLGLVFFLTLSKGGILSFVIALFVFMFFYKRIKNKKLFFVCLFCLFACLSIFLFLPQEIKSAVFLRLKAKTFAVRLDYWKVALSIFRDYPLVGCGSDNYGLLYPLYWQKNTEITQLAHNNYLQILAETGIIGGFFFCGLMFRILCMLLSFFKKFTSNSLDAEDSYNRNMFSLCLAVSLLAVMIHFAVDFDLYIFSLFAYFTVFLAFFTLWHKQQVKTLFILKGLKLKLVLVLLLAAVLTFSFLLKKKLKSDFIFFEAKQSYQQGDMNKAVKKAQQAIDAGGENYIYSFFVSRAFYKAKQLSASLYWAQKAVQQNKYMGDAYKQMADIYFFMQRQENRDYGSKMEDMLKKACFYAPHKLKYKTDLADFYMAGKNYKSALSVLKEAEDFWPDDKKILDKLNKCKLALKKGE